MAMEGINWDEVNAEAKAIFVTVRTAEDQLYRECDDFADELSFYWASGNAVQFGKDFFGVYKEVITFMEEKVDQLEGYIQRAAQIYSTTFNVSNGFQFNGQGFFENLWSDITKNAVVLGDNIAGGLGNFKDAINGTTGMNRSGAQEALDKFNGKLNSLLDELSTSLNNRDIALFDVQGEQKEAYLNCVKEMRDGISTRIGEVLKLVTEGIGNEEDKVQLAKTQTVNTFSA